MTANWTIEEINSILLQLNNQSYPFKKYRFTENNGELLMLGTGGFGYVFETYLINNPKKKFALKVLGFGNKHVDSSDFNEYIDVQKELSYSKNDVVKVVKHTELWLSIDNNMNVIEIVSTLEKVNNLNGNTLHLQFLMMEKLTPIITFNGQGVPSLYPKELAEFNETEIFKLAYSIGYALSRAHDKKLLHRDIKLENIFYDEKNKQYKLGDFGIAKLTNSGMASTVAFTKGYGAPEITINNGNRYDCTADIYSFGITLYLLLNELKFPGAQNYHASYDIQYSKGYVLPAPIMAHSKLYDVVKKMCNYNPDERYQSVNEVLNELEGIYIGSDIKIKQQQRKTYYTGGLLCFFLGLSLWKATHHIGLTLDLTILEYIFLICGCYKCWLNVRKRKSGFFTFILLCIGIIIIFKTDFSWWKLFIILGIIISGEGFSGVASLGILIVDVVSKFLTFFPQVYFLLITYNWLPILLFSLSLMLYIQVSFIKERTLKKDEIFITRFFWIIMGLMYVVFLSAGISYDRLGNAYIYTLKRLHMPSFYIDIIRNYDCKMIGSCGLVFTIIWFVREKVISVIKSYIEQDS